MKFPEYTSHDDFELPIREVINVFARCEAGIRSNAKSWSQHLGVACVQLARDNTIQAREAIKRIKKNNNIPPKHKHTPNLLQQRNNPNALAREQRAMHATVMGKLTKDLQLYASGGDSVPIGTITERTALGLLSRYAHPWMLVVPALPHLDQGDMMHQQNFDICMAVNEAGEQRGYMLQVKTDCCGRCGLNGKKADTEGYTSNIQFVSGCCDLGLKDEDSKFCTDVPGLLVKEFHGSATTEQVNYLDVLTDNLLFNITADLLPRGDAMFSDGLTRANSI